MEGLARLDDVKWEKLLEFCDLAHLTLPLAEVAGHQLPAWVAERLARNIRDNKDRFDNVFSCYIEAKSALDRAGIPHVVLKGFTQAPEFVNDPRFRMQSDIDIFCPPEYTLEAESVLLALGYSSVGRQRCDADHVPALSRPGSWKWRGNSYDPAMPPSIEIHLCLWNESNLCIKMPEIEFFWRRRVTITQGDLTWVALSTPDKLAFLCLHILRGVLCGDWVVHHVRELAHFLQNHAHDAEFWSEWLDLYSIQQRRLQVIAISLAQSWFSCPMPEVVDAVLNGLPAAQRHWLKRFGGSPLEVMFRHNKDGRLLHWLLADSPQARTGVLRRALLPTYIASPTATAKRTHLRRQVKESESTPALWRYLKYLCSRSWRHVSMDAEFVVHGASAWLTTRTLRNQFWLFAGASFFLTWACQSISSSSIWS